MIVLGGAGDMASRAVRELALEPDVGRVTFAVLNLEGAMRLAAELGDRAVPLPVDASDRGALVEAVRGHEVGASGIGPLYLYEARVAKAAIEVGVAYVSLCDDYDAAQGVLRLPGEARLAGVTVLTWLGWTPGLSDLLARRGAEPFDRLD